MQVKKQYLKPGGVEVILFYHLVNHLARFYQEKGAENPFHGIFSIEFRGSGICVYCEEDYTVTSEVYVLRIFTRPHSKFDLQDHINDTRALIMKDITCPLKKGAKIICNC